MAQLPRCRNFIKGNCPQEDMQVLQEMDNAWVFQCGGCELVQVITKDAERDKNIARHAEQNRAKNIAFQRMREARRKIHA